MRKCEVLVDRLGLTVHKGSIVNVSDRQYELIKDYVRVIEETMVAPAEATETPETPKRRGRKASKPIG